jgi:hypothetical protein
MMLLYVSPDDLQRFAGKFEEDEARKAAGEFSDWAKSSGTFNFSFSIFQNF